MSFPDRVGPLLFLRGGDHDYVRLSALMVSTEGAPPDLRPMGGARVDPIALDVILGSTVWLFDFALPVDAEAFYQLDDERFPVATDVSAKRRIAYVSCNGQEHADDQRPLGQRNRMWRRLADEHAQRPFSVMLHGGDQLYADEVLTAHPTLQAWAGSDLEHKGSHRFVDHVKTAAESYLFQRYAELYTQADIAFLLARIPSVMMWDDHDIIDGWGSHPQAMLDSEVGQGVFMACRRMFMLFQLGANEAHPPEAMRRVDMDSSLGFAVALPDFDLIVPDLRSERRPDRVMGPTGWALTERALARRPAGHRRFLMSSVPLLGPRLSWIEALIGFVPKLKRYEDDLRDQWQSRAHRGEWQRLLSLLEETTPDGCALTVLSGEIHLATQGAMPLASGKIIRQLVASGIAHPPPPAIYARALGWLAAFGEDPLPGQPIQLSPLPGQRQIYMAERNFLVLERDGEAWHAYWELEESGRTPSELI